MGEGPVSGLRPDRPASSWGAGLRNQPLPAPCPHGQSTRLCRDGALLGCPLGLPGTLWQRWTPEPQAVASRVWPGACTFPAQCQLPPGPLQGLVLPLSSWCPWGLENLPASSSAGPGPHRMTLQSSRELSLLLQHEDKGQPRKRMRPRGGRVPLAQCVRTALEPFSCPLSCDTTLRP